MIAEITLYILYIDNSMQAALEHDVAITLTHMRNDVLALRQSSRMPLLSMTGRASGTRCARTGAD
jgi:hypothetical protein